MAASYPGAVKVFTPKVDGPGQWIWAEHVNSLQDEVVAIETALGVDLANVVRLGIFNDNATAPTGISTTSQTVLELHRDTNTNTDTIDLLFQADDSVGNVHTYGAIVNRIVNSIDGGEQGEIQIHANFFGATVTSFLTISAPAIVINPGLLDTNTFIRGDTDTSLFYADAGNNAITIGSLENLAYLGIDGQRDRIQFAVQGVAGQTADLIVGEASDGYDWFVVEADGQVRISSTEGNVLRIHRDTNTNFDSIGLVFEADNDAGAVTTYGTIRGQIRSNVAGSESGALQFRALLSGANLLIFSVINGNFLINENNSNDIDFQVEGGSISHLFFTDATPTTENIALLAAAAPNWQTMDRGLFIGNMTTAPTGDPAGGGFLYVDSGILTYRSPTTQLKLVFDNVDNVTFAVDTDGYLSITPSGGQSTFVGNVGIGVSDPDARLEVMAAGAADALKISRTGSASNMVFDLSGGRANLTVTNGMLTMTDSKVDDTDKLLRFGATHFDTDEEPVWAIYCSNVVATNNVNIGGGTATGNAATRITLYTAADTVTTTGSARVIIDSNGQVGIGITPVGGQVHIDQADASGAIAVLKLDQGDVSEDFVDYIGVSAASVVNPITTWTTGNTIQGFVRVGINGAFFWMPYYDAPTS